MNTQLDNDVTDRTVQIYVEKNRIVMIDWIGCHLSWKIDRTMMWPIIHIWSSQNTMLNYQDWIDNVSMMKMRKDNYVTHRISLLYAKK